MGKRSERRLLELLDQRDQQIEEMTETIERLRREADGAVWSEWMPRELEDVETLPLPRLEIEIAELTAQYDDAEVCLGIVYIYRLVYRHLTGFVRSIPLGRTTSTGGRMPRVRARLGVLDWPFRDGAHIHHDAAHLGLPGFLRRGDEVLPLQPEDYTVQTDKGRQARRLTKTGGV